MRAFITGGAGCIGSDLAEELAARGHEVVVFDNLSSGKMEHLAKLEGSRNFRFIEGDLCDMGALQSALAGADIVFHMAANPDVKFTPGDRTDKDLQQNTLCTYHVLESMRIAGIRRIVFSSTSAVYGIVERLPIPEEGVFPKPISLYGATKLACEGLISSFSHLFGMQAWIFRFANIVGPKTRKRGGTVIGDFIARLAADGTRLRILGDGKQAKSYLLSTECVEAMLYAVEHAHEPLNIYNLGCSDSLTVNRIADMVVDAMGLRNVQYEHTGGEGGWPGDVPRFLLDVTRINQLGWRARHTSAEAVSMAIRSTLEQMGIQAPCASH
jgi:UDP-glucose 4-epimerase